MRSKGKFEPKMVGIICNWCCYGGADLCGVSRFQYPTYIKLIRVMCSGRVDLKHIFLAFANGADAMFVGGCHINDCHYNAEGNYDALSMVSLCHKLMEHIGINPKRLRLEWVSAGEGIRFANLMNEFAKETKALGPLGTSEGMDENELQKRVDKVTKLIPYIKLRMQEKLALHDLKSAIHETYKNVYSREEIENLILEAPSYWIDPEKCRACMSCSMQCPVDAIISVKQHVHVVDQGRCIKCGTCLGTEIKLIGHNFNKYQLVIIR